MYVDFFSTVYLSAEQNKQDGGALVAVVQPMK